MRLLPLGVLFLLALNLSGCLWHRQEKPGTRLYDGNSPSIRMMDKPETAGGRMQTY